MKSYFNSKVARFLILLILMLGLFLFLDYYAFSTTGFDDPAVIEIRNFYFSSAVIASVILLASMFYVISEGEGDRKYGRSVGFASPGSKPGIRFFKRFTIFQITLISLILFLIVGLANFQGMFGAQKTYTGVGTLVEKQQFTEGQSLLYTLFLVPTAENLPFYALLAILSIGWGLFARKKNLNFGLYTGILFLFALIIGGLYGRGMHQIVYGASDISLNTVFTFWAFGAIVTMLTQLATPFWIIHFVNNLFVALSNMISPDIISLIVIISIIGLSAIYFIIYRGRLLGDPNLQYEN